MKKPALLAPGLVLAAAFAPWAASVPASPEGADRFAAVKEWRLTFDWSVDAHHRGRVSEGDNFLSVEDAATVSAHADYRLSVTDHQDDGDGLVWSTPEESAPSGSAHVSWSKSMRGPRGVDGVVATRREAFRATRVGGGSAVLRISRKRGTYEVNGAVDVAGRSTVRDGADEKSEDSSASLSMNPRDREKHGKTCRLPDAGLVLSGTHEFPRSLGPFCDVEPGMKLESWAFAPWAVVKVRWTLTPWKEREDARLVFAPVDRKLHASWIPAPEPEGTVSFESAGTLAVRAAIQLTAPGAAPRKGRIAFTLGSVTVHEGRCGNFPRDLGAKHDLRIKPRDDLDVDPDDPGRVVTKEAVTEATVEIEALDAGAYGELSVECRELGLRGEDPGTGRRHLDVPLDENHNRIADAWERSVGVTDDHPASWDEDPEPRNQLGAGDGFSLQDEYRGFVVLEKGVRVFRRLDPLRKELFVIDDGHVLDADAWFKVSGIRARFVEDSLVKSGHDRRASRIVNFNGPVGHQHCVKLETMPGLGDEGGASGASSSTFGYVAPLPVRSPADAKLVRVFPKRLRAKVDRIAAWLQRALSGGPDNFDAKKLQAYLDAHGLPRHLAEKALARLGDDVKQRLADQWVAVCALHEVAHACGVPGHLEPDPTAEGESVEGSGGAPGCPMSYPDEDRENSMIVLQALFKLDGPLLFTCDRLCVEADEPPLAKGEAPHEAHRCWQKVNVRDD